MQRELHPDPRRERALLPDSSIGRVRAFHIDVDDRVLADLDARLRRTHLTRSRITDWSRGTSPAYLRGLLAYWRDSYDWRAQELELARDPQFIARIDDRDVHFIHVRSAAPDALPLLLLHGWPDTFVRFHAAIPALATRHHLVIPSLPGCVFSDPIGARPRPLARSAELLWKLMARVLGYDQFGVAGSDTGATIAQLLAIDHPLAVAGIHLTDLGWRAEVAEPPDASRAERRYVARLHKAQQVHGASRLVESTRPRSLAPSLTDSPVGLASWIVDQLQAASDGDPDARIGADALLANIMLYWATGSIGSAMDTLVAEREAPSLDPAVRVDVPAGLALFPHELGGIPPRSLAERTLDVHRWTEMPRGGHLGPIEEPGLYARDVLALFESLEEV